MLVFFETISSLLSRAEAPGDLERRGDVARLECRDLLPKHDELTLRLADPSIGGCGVIGSFR
jgi:hypothetical protein